MYTTHPRAIRIWLYTVAALIFAMVIVGGATRLTGSGLSITEWKPILGAIPPLNHDDWMQVFEKYKAIPQYALINKGMSLTEFQGIFWWEWGHRFLGRIIGLAFALPFLIFALNKWISKPLMLRCVVLLALGGLQGFMGWYMVQSGLSERVSVSHFRLAAHLILACILFSAILWTAWNLDVPKLYKPIVPSHITRAKLLLALVFIQIIWGAFVAGSHAGFIYNSWPLMDGALVPDSLFTRKFLHDAMPLQWLHRMIAYGLLGLATWNLLCARNRIAFCLFLAVSIQAILGMLTLIYITPLHLALTHQAGAMVVLTMATRQAFEVRGRS